MFVLVLRSPNRQPEITRQRRSQPVFCPVPPATDRVNSPVTKTEMGYIPESFINKIPPPGTWRCPGAYTDGIVDAQIRQPFGNERLFPLYEGRMLLSGQQSVPPIFAGKVFRTSRLAISLS
jgi:hypothetical protein